MQISVDTGGTFTDCVYLTPEGLRVLKVPSTPTDPGAAILNVTQQITGDTAVEVRHGTTVGTNALLERKGARVAFVTTSGFEDTIAIGRQDRPKLYDLFFQKPEPLAREELRFGVRERVSSDGTILQSVTTAELDRLRSVIAAAKPESIAVSLLFAFANPENEKAVCHALAGLGVPVSASHKILPEFREYERASTVVVNAYLAPKMQSYLGNLDRKLNLSVMQSSGGIVNARLAAEEPVRTILSGPAGGVVGAMYVAGQAGFQKALSFDMGGTSTDVALIDGARGLETTTESHIQGMPVAVPVLRIHTVGAGGGSIASFDGGGALKVGPESAGAVPGPVCYGRGNQPTVTDANLILSRLDPDGFLGGVMKLDSERAKSILENAKGPLLTIESFAEGIVALANSHMAQALRRISVEQGHDPREFTLVSFGGAGPLHACDLAQALQIPRVLIPNFPGALSAYGILLSDITRDYSRTVMLRPNDPAILRYFQELEPSTERWLDLRYKGQGYELRVPFTEDYVAAFHKLHQQRYRYSDTQREIEVVNVRVRHTTKTEKPSLPKFPLQFGQPVGKPTRIYADGEWRRGTIYTRKSLKAGNTCAGPAVITEYSATTYLPPASIARVDEWLNLIVEFA
jgi:N-methylhydantoinase A